MTAQLVLTVLEALVIIVAAAGVAILAKRLLRPAGRKPVSHIPPEGWPKP